MGFSSAQAVEENDDREGMLGKRTSGESGITNCTDRTAGDLKKRARFDSEKSMPLDLSDETLREMLRDQVEEIAIRKYTNAYPDPAAHALSASNLCNQEIQVLFTEKQQAQFRAANNIVTPYQGILTLIAAPYKDEHAFTDDMQSFAMKCLVQKKEGDKFYTIAGDALEMTTWTKYVLIQGHIMDFASQANYEASTPHMHTQFEVGWNSTKYLPKKGHQSFPIGSTFQSTQSCDEMGIKMGKEGSTNQQPITTPQTEQQAQLHPYPGQLPDWLSERL